MNSNFVARVINDIKKINEKNNYQKFILLWIIIEAYISEKSGLKTKKDAILWFIENKDTLRETAFEFSNPSSGFDYIENSVYMFNSSPEKYFGKTFQGDKKRICYLIYAIYKTRCNLIHGNWQFDSDNLSKEKDLINTCTNFMINLIRAAQEKRVFL